MYIYIRRAATTAKEFHPDSFIRGGFLFMIGLLGLVFSGPDGLSGHVAWIEMERSRLFFARSLSVWILIVVFGHGIAPATLTPLRL